MVIMDFHMSFKHSFHTCVAGTVLGAMGSNRAEDIIYAFKEFTSSLFTYTNLTLHKKNKDILKAINEIF